MATITYAPERAVYSLEDGMESAGPLTLVSNPAEYIRLDLHEAAVAAARAEGMREAHAIAAKFEDKYWRPMRVFRTEEEAAIDDGKRDVAEEIANAILAAMPEVAA